MFPYAHFILIIKLVLTMCLRVPAAGYTPGVGVQQQSSHSQTQQTAVLGTYSPVASHQCSGVQVNTLTRSDKAALS